MEKQKDMQPQKPLSHAYLATDSLRGPSAILKISEGQLQTELRMVMKALDLKSEDIEETLEDINEDLENSYIEVLKQNLRKRVAEDPDFDENRHKHLKKFISNNQ